MAIVPSVVQYEDHFTFPALNHLFSSSVNLFVIASSYDRTRITLNGETVMPWTSFLAEGDRRGGTRFGYFNMQRVSSGVHRFEHEESNAIMTATVYGLGFLGSFAYAAGLELSIRNGMCVHITVL